jgi:hypothetical protein
MSSNYLKSAGFVATFAVALAGCAGTMEDSSTPEVVGEGGELVARKQQWLQDYDANCDVCFKAFELCEKGAAEDQATLDACQTALDSCVKGGLIKDDEDDADADDENADDNGEEEEDADAGVEDDGDDNGGDDGNVDNGEEEEEEDAGVEDDGDDNNGDDDGNVDNGEEEEEEDADEDVDVDEAVDEANGDNDGDNNGQPGDQAKAELIEAIQACLDDASTCFQADNADVRECLDGLKTCVDEALDGAFEGVCEDQRDRCEERDASDEEVESVNDLCEAGREFSVD